MGGTGLGLSLCYSMVKEHKGEIYFDSKQNCGTTFNVLLPIISMSKKCRIMIVDDDNAFRRMLKKALTKETSYIVEDFSNGFEALIRIGSNPPDLLILDMFMPDLDGIGVCRAVKNEIGLEMTKVIIITGYPEHENIKEAMKMGIQKVLNKPIIVDVLLKAVKESLDGKLTL
jgi:CheY-like chemotaxis protein